MFDIHNIPKSISVQIDGQKANINDIGMSGATVMMFDDSVLKISKTADIADNEHKMLQWLKDKLPVPRILGFEEKDGYNFLLMSRLKGEISCSNVALSNLDNTVKALANGLKMLWSVDIKRCPIKNDIKTNLKKIKKQIKSGSLEFKDNIEKSGFSNMEAFFSFLKNNRPKEELVLSHGDYCMPNVFVLGEKAIGFIDVGYSGISDKWRDISTCVRSIYLNIVKYGGMSEAIFEHCKILFFNELGLEPDEKKMKYYMVYNEVF